MSNDPRGEIAQLLSANAKVTRQEIFGLLDPKPLHLADDAETMFAGYVSTRYRAGNPLLLAINPGGGGDTYTVRTAEDRRFYPLLRQLRDADGAASLLPFEAINRAFAEVLPRWNVMRIVAPVLDATGATLDDIAYLNAVPYRTRGDKEPSVPAKASAWSLVTGPSIRALHPGVIVALGKKAGNVLDRFHEEEGPPVFTLPRTIGDRTLSAAAKAVLAQIPSCYRRLCS